MKLVFAIYKKEKKQEYDWKKDYKNSQIDKHFFHIFIIPLKGPLR